MANINIETKSQKNIFKLLTHNSEYWNTVSSVANNFLICRLGSAAFSRQHPLEHLFLKTHSLAAFESCEFSRNFGFLLSFGKQFIQQKPFSDLPPHPSVLIRVNKK